MSITATTASACPCCGTCVTGTLSCRTRGGTATLCGSDEFIASSPPKKYRTKTLTGSRKNCSYDDSACAGALVGTERVDYSGSCTYDSATCVTTNDLGYKLYQNFAATVCYTDATTLVTTASLGCDFDWTSDTMDPNDSVTTAKTPTAWSIDGAGVCFGSGGSYRFHLAGNVRTLNLTSEDTEGTAITRVLAANPWGSYAAPDGGHCRAAWENRTSGFSFEYLEAGYRVAATGLTPGQRCRVIVEIWRRTYGVGSYALFQTVTLGGTADGGGNLQVDGDVPNEKGFESYAVMGTCPP